MYTTDMYEGMLAETITIQGHGGDWINAYYARPLGRRAVSEHRRDPPPSGLGRVLPRDYAQVRAPRLRCDQSESLFPRGARRAG